MKIRTLSLCALFTAVALIIFRIEALIPMPFPGIKLGLANIVTLTAFFFLKKRWVFLIVISRAVLGGLLIGNPMSIFYSLVGGSFCFIITALLIRRLPFSQTWALGVLGAIFHTIGQIIVAISFTRSLAILIYAPILLISAILTGSLTGTLAQLLIKRLSKVRELKKDLILKKGELS